MNPRIAAIAIVALAACTDDVAAPPVRPDGPEAGYVTAARDRFPRAIDLHTKVIARSCSPNPGVCHSASGYPDLSSVGAMLGAIDAPCNVELPDREQGWDGCERRPWRVLAGGFESDVAWTQQVASGRWRFGLRKAAAATARPIVTILDDDGETVLPAFADWQITLAIASGAREAELAIAGDDASMKRWLDSIAASVVGGDPNGNGTWGGGRDDDERGALIVPGSLERSYLWGRLTETVPGTRMPLANAPLTNDEYVALACWIETLGRTPFPRAADPIDYDDCVFAWFPIEYQ